MESDDRVIKKRNPRSYITAAFNISIICLAGVGIVRMIRHMDTGAELVSDGFENFKYYTVLSNVICCAVAVLWLIFFLLRRKFPVLPKLMTASAVGLTFVTIAAFLQPLYPDLNLYEGSNKFFHLIVPLIAIVEFIFMEVDGKIPFRYTFLAVIPAVLYGIGYVINILINGVGEWPDSNDWYGFLNWGYPVGFGIFVGIVIMNWLIACVLRGLNYLMNKMIYSIKSALYK
ncbi:MAG: hypothetical protein IKS48_08775 [Eubacterium sp.]|nr:hypothetical protein [Eubacterium sp.]